LALTLVATPGGANSNAYATVAEATTELSYRVGGEAWVDETSDQQIQDLVTAASVIDALILSGEPSTTTQAMAFPRDGETDIPLEVWKANIVLALDIAKKRQAGVVDVVNPALSNVQRAKSGDDEVQFFAQSSDLNDPYSLYNLPLEVQRLLTLFVVIPASLGWGSATVVRTS
jgi:hypothetical protein